MTDTIIEVENLGKRYVLDHQQEREKYTALRDVIAQGVKSALKGFSRQKTETKEEFWALKDVSFEVKRGEVVGIIGRNGAGKSTLLKILSRITEPTTGRVRLKGRVASLLEVGTGFHPELTGRENIYLNGAVLGMMREEIDRKFDEIVAFAEVEKFLDTPVKRYSSGMYVRLAFAVAAHLEPEILVVDEVLAVGDAAFQKKCLGKMGDVASKEGRTVLFVSHNMAALSSLCSTGVFLEKGKIKKNGNVQDCVNGYLDDHQDLSSNSWRGYIGNKIICLTEIAATQNNINSVFFVTHQETTIRLKYKVSQPIEGLIVGIRITSFQGNSLAYARVDDYLDNEEEYSSIGEHFLEVSIPANLLAQGKYIINIDIGIHNIARIVDQSIIVQFVNTEGIGRKYLVSGIGFDDIFRPKWIWKPIKFNSLSDA